MIVLSTQPSTVDKVFVGGRPLKRGGKLVAYNVDKIVDDANETMDRVRAEVARQNRSAADVEKEMPAQRQK